jgi:hypothetical protein
VTWLPGGLQHPFLRLIKCVVPGLGAWTFALRSWKLVAIEPTDFADNASLFLSRKPIPSSSAHSGHVLTTQAGNFRSLTPPRTPTLVRIRFGYSSLGDRDRNKLAHAVDRHNERESPAGSRPGGTTSESNATKFRKSA